MRRPLAGFPRALVAVLTVLALVPVGTGALGIIGGLAFGPGSGEVVSYFDSEYRFLNGIWLACGVVLLWSTRRPAARAATTRVVLAAILLGGLSRSTSALVTGWPPGVFGVSLLIELIAVPVLISWHIAAFPIPRTQRSVAFIEESGDRRDT